MKKVLTIRTREPDPFVAHILEGQRADAGLELVEVNLDEVKDPDYSKLVHQIFEADAIHVW
jgi:hypothetical protein